MAVSANSARFKFLESITSNSSESDVEHKVIIPLLKSLGYHDADWKTQVTVGKVKLDFLVQSSRFALHPLPYLVIEAKAPKKNLAKNLWQLNSYLRETGAALGLLTNGYQFQLVYHYDGEIHTIATYSQKTLIENFSLFHKLCSRATCLKFGDNIHSSQQQVHFKFATQIATVVANQDMLERLFNRKKAASKGKIIQPPLIEGDGATDENIKERNGMIITVFNNKGGVGKTTTTINLAAALSKLGKRVLLIDVDAQANLTTGLGIDPLADIEEQGRKDITHLLTETKTLLPSTIIHKQWKDISFDIVPSHIRLSDMESTLIQTVDVDRVLIRKLKSYKKDYDFILIDPPPSFGKVNTISLMAASGILIPTQLSPYPIRALEYVINRAQAVEQSRDEPLPILGVAVSMYDKRATVLKQEMTGRIQNILKNVPGGENISLFPESTWVPQLKIVSSTPEKGYPICEAEFDSLLTRSDKESAQEAFNCYSEMAQHLIKLVEQGK